MAASGRSKLYPDILGKSIVAVVSLACLLPLLLKWGPQSDERMIAHELTRLCSLFEKTMPDTVKSSRNRRESITAMLADPVVVRGHSPLKGRFNPKKAASHALRHRNRRHRFAVRFTDCDLAIEGERAVANLTAVALVSKSQTSIEYRSPVEIELTRQKSGWKFKSFTFKKGTSKVTEKPKPPVPKRKNQKKTHR